MYEAGELGARKMREAYGQLGGLVVGQ